MTMRPTITLPKTLGGPKARAHIRAKDEAKVTRERARVWTFESDEEKRNGRDETAKEFAELAEHESEWAEILEAGRRVRLPRPTTPPELAEHEAEWAKIIEIHIRAKPKPAPAATPAKPA